MLISAERKRRAPKTLFVPTNIKNDDRQQVSGKYVERGECDNRNEELKNHLDIDHTSCHGFPADQLRLFLRAAAFVLFNCIARFLCGTQWAKAPMCALQRDVVKLGRRIPESSRKLCLHFASNCAVVYLWFVTLGGLQSGA